MTKNMTLNKLNLQEIKTNSEINEIDGGTPLLDKNTEEKIKQNIKLLFNKLLKK